MKHLGKTLGTVSLVAFLGSGVALLAILAIFFGAYSGILPVQLDSLPSRPITYLVRFLIAGLAVPAVLGATVLRLDRPALQLVRWQLSSTACALLWCAAAAVAVFDNVLKPILGD